MPIQYRPDNLAERRSVPSLPPGISVCFVGGQSFNDSGPDVQVRQR